MKCFKKFQLLAADGGGGDGWDILGTFRLVFLRYLNNIESYWFYLFNSVSRENCVVKIDTLFVSHISMNNAHHLSMYSLKKKKKERIV